MLRDARDAIEAWRHDRSQSRPYSSLNHRTPTEFSIQRRRRQIEQEAGPRIGE